MSTPQGKELSRECFFFVLTVSLAAHFSFSRYGYNPTDDGFILAYSARILDGQIPHLDFISIRPILSALIHAPIVAFGGDSTFYLSRFFVWVEFAAIAWLWSSIIGKGTPIYRSRILRIMLGLIIFLLTVNYYPVMAWHTIDGLLLSTIGLFLVLRESVRSKCVGYLLIGASVLCKQSFGLMAPMSLLIVGDWRQIRYWILSMTPVLLYVTYLFVAGAFGDAVIQIGSQVGIFDVGVKQYIIRWMLYAGLAGGFVLRLLAGQKTPPKISKLGTLSQYLLIALPLLGAGVSLAMANDSGMGLWRTSFGLFGLCLGASLLPWINCKTRVRIILLVLLTSWSISISLGYNTPVIGSGIMVAALIVTATLIGKELQKKPLFSLLSFGLIVLLISFSYTRLNNVYLDRPASELTHDIGSVFPAGRDIRSTRNTYLFYEDLAEAIDSSKCYAERYALLPDNPGFWVNNSQPNPLPIDWAQSTELNKRELVDRVILKLEEERSDIAVIVQKYKASELRHGYIPIADRERFEVLFYVRDNFRKVSETRLFDIYR